MPASSEPRTRSQFLSAVRTVVIKLGTQLLAGKEGRLDTDFIASIAAQVAELRRRGIQVTIVSSGAVGAGLRELNIPKRPTDLSKLQAVAAVGQRRLMDVWGAAFEPFNLPVAQLLLTRNDIDNRKRFLNLRNTIHAVHALGAVPIINENDTVSTDEMVKITFGDNDILASLVTHAIRANLLVLMTVVDGLLDAGGKPVRLVDSIDHARALIRTEKSPLGKGGMDSKLRAAQTVTESGEAMVVAHGRMENVLPRLLDGEDIGTLFVPAPKKKSSRTRWIGSVQPVGTVGVDAGCVRALVERNKSLLPAGVTSVTGDFSRGDVIAVVGPDGRTVARGLSNYDADDVAKIKGKRTIDVRATFKDCVVYDEIVHRDNLVIA